MGTEVHEHDRGLAADLSMLFDRRRMLRMMALTGIGVAEPPSGLNLPKKGGEQRPHSRVRMEA